MEIFWKAPNRCKGGELVASADSGLDRFLRGALLDGDSRLLGELFAYLLPDRDLVCTIVEIFALGSFLRETGFWK
jgi:hypothetical protein